MKYVIPSYKRSEKLKLLSLRFLNSHKIKNEDIFIFVRVDDSDLQEYIKLREEGYNVEVLVGITGIGNTHNAITEYFEENEYIIELDDDLIDIVDKDLNSLVSLSEKMEEMVLKMKEDNISYGGLYQVSNKLFMSGCEEYTKDLRYILGIFRIRKINKSIKLETQYAEDFENAILHYIKDGKILKNNHLCAKTKNYAVGGCAGDGRNIETEKVDKVFLSEKYPEYTRLFQRKNGHWDLRLKEYKVKLSLNDKHFINFQNGIC